MSARDERRRQSRTLESSDAYLDRVRAFMKIAEGECLPQRALQAVAAAERFMDLAVLARRLEQRSERPLVRHATELMPAGSGIGADGSARTE